MTLKLIDGTCWWRLGSSTDSKQVMMDSYVWTLASDKFKYFLFNHQNDENENFVKSVWSYVDCDALNFLLLLCT